MGGVRAHAIPVALAMALVAAAGCGGGSNDAKDEIKGVLETSFTTSDPAQCDEVTEKGLNELNPSVAKAKDPAAACKEALDPSANADSIDITNLNVDGSHATATVTAHGGAYAGTAVAVELADDNGWKLDGFGQIHLVDRDAYLASLDQRAETGTFGTDTLTPKDARCVAADVRRNASTADLDRSLATGDRGFLYDAVRNCLGGGLDFIAIIHLIENQLKASGIPADQASCMAALSLAGQQHNMTVEDFAESKQAKGRIGKVLKQGAFLCRDAGRGQ